ncbi:hypothetical protein W822_04360 [Advenella kashmirensis W13003]|uniref:Uncharacterized protein n=1 Tax=Advenella kashmirensis W13003 TaxID=1424334 RepID=V8QYK7_9BURK|nr:hypothetical protein W822_04360 [Advenella kashmirensis W13003]
MSEFSVSSQAGVGLRVVAVRAGQGPQAITCASASRPADASER